MTWVKLDDQFVDHPKVVEAGPLASWLYVCGLTYASRLRTDGFIPAAQVRRLADIEDADQWARVLVGVGLWEEVEGGYQIHDYGDYQLTKADYQRKQEAGKAGGQASAKARGQAPAEAPARKVLNRSHKDKEKEPKEEKSESAPAKPSRARPRNVVWDALAEQCGAPETDSEESDFGKTVKELKQARASPTEIAAFPVWWDAEMPPGTLLTHRCYRNHWSAFKNGLKRAGENGMSMLDALYPELQPIGAIDDD